MKQIAAKCVERIKPMSNLEINAKFANTVLAAVLVAILTIGGYMASWNRDDHSHKQLVEERLLNIAARLSKIEAAVEDGILPQAKWRVERLERYVDEM